MKRKILIGLLTLAFLFPTKVYAKEVTSTGGATSVSFTYNVEGKVPDVEIDKKVPRTGDILSEGYGETLFFTFGSALILLVLLYQKQREREEGKV
ncbi:MAG TPA: hypothetical protein H9858_07085 [Candidatus Blautia stercoravium]|nr:hypothetical protein [Candidatus Blautia stercoravium]